MGSSSISVFIGCVLLGSSMGIVIAMFLSYIFNKTRDKYFNEYIERKRSKFIETYETRWCPFCKSDNIFSESWSPEKCMNCGATYMFGIWKRNEGDE